jgi:arylsulfatase A-like enzyme
MVTELDYGVGNVTAALKRLGYWANTVLVLVSDNGAQLDHGHNAPLRGGKHTFWEGGVRVVSFMSSPLIPPHLHGTNFSGMAHSSDWYVTFVDGLAGGNMTDTMGLPNGAADEVSESSVRPLDGVNLWPAIVGGTASPRTEVVHAVSSR